MCRSAYVECFMSVTSEVLVQLECCLIRQQDLFGTEPLFAITLRLIFANHNSVLKFLPSEKAAEAQAPASKFRCFLTPMRCGRVWCEAAF